MVKMVSCMYCVRQFQVNRWLIFLQGVYWKLGNGRNSKFKSSQDLVHRNNEKRYLVWGKYLFDCDINLSPIFRRFSINLPQPQRSYAAYSDFRRKKLKIFCDINLTQSGWGQLDLYKTFENFRNVWLLKKGSFFNNM